MASLISCDKCGKIDNKVKTFMHVKFYRMEDAENYKPGCVKYMDVCPECYNKIIGKEE